MRIPILVLLLAALVPLSCRTYGGHGSEEAALRQIEAAHVEFERDLVRAKNDMRSVAEAADANASLGAIASRLEAVVLAHEAMLTHHATQVEEARHARTYRKLNRTLGGIIADQDVVYERYRDILQLARARRDTTAGRRGQSPSVIPRYHVVPPYFERMQNASYFGPIGGIAQALAAETSAAPPAEAALAAEGSATEAASDGGVPAGTADTATGQ